MVTVIKSASVSSQRFRLGELPEPASIARPAVAPERAGDLPSRMVATVAPQEEPRSLERDSEAFEQHIAGLVAERVDLELAARLEEARIQWAAEAELVREEAQRSGYEAGLERAIEQNAARHAEARQHLVDLTESIDGTVTAALESVVELACRVAFEALLKMLADAAESGELVQRVVAARIAELETQGLVLLRVHPDDAALLAESFEQANQVSVRLVADKQIARGGCIAETPRGILDARMETQLAALLAALRGNPAAHPEAEQA
ncbi:MAG: FliH/SctL family protein [Rhodocyclaceae bacterium]